MFEQSLGICLKKSCISSILSSPLSFPLSPPELNPQQISELSLERVLEAFDELWSLKGWLGSLGCGKDWEGASALGVVGWGLRGESQELL